MFIYVVLNVFIAIVEEAFFAASDEMHEALTAQASASHPVHHQHHLVGAGLVPPVAEGDTRAASAARAERAAAALVGGNREASDSRDFSQNTKLGTQKSIQGFLGAMHAAERTKTPPCSPLVGRSPRGGRVEGAAAAASLRASAFGQRGRGDGTSFTPVAAGGAASDVLHDQLVAVVGKKLERALGASELREFLRDFEVELSEFAYCVVEKKQQEEEEEEEAED